ncbi:hypothetical protein A9Q99_17975 [Gammaproteobacteria bacterium 45_16_T64]|nr:hypothetical protein A9Q99_17975 [Gammaproteobacteria bacterium 45_16_T64]
MKWISMLYTGAATPVHAMTGILGVCVVAFSFAGALGGFMEKFTYAVFFLYGIFLFYCAFFSRLLVEANRLEDDDPKRGKLIGLSYVYQSILIPVILVMMWWILSTAIGKANNLVITAKSISEPLIREFEHMTMGSIEYDEGLNEKGEVTLTLKLSGFLQNDDVLERMVDYPGKEPVRIEMSVSSDLVNLPGYEIFIDNNPIELKLDVNRSVNDDRPYLDSCYIHIPVLSPELGDIPQTKIVISSYHEKTLMLHRGVELHSSGVVSKEELLLGEGSLMLKYKDHNTYYANGRVGYCRTSIENKGKNYFDMAVYQYLSDEIVSRFIYPNISTKVISYSAGKRHYLRSWKRFQSYLRSGFEGLFH